MWAWLYTCSNLNIVDSKHFLKSHSPWSLFHSLKLFMVLIAYSRCPSDLASSFPFPVSDNGSALSGPKPFRDALLCLFPFVWDEPCLCKRHQFRKGMQAVFSVIIPWDSYFIITPLYLSSVIDIGVVCFHCISHPSLPREPQPWLDAVESLGGGLWEI